MYSRIGVLAKLSSLTSNSGSLNKEIFGPRNSVSNKVIIDMETETSIATIDRMRDKSMGVTFGIMLGVQSTKNFLSGKG